MRRALRSATRRAWVVLACAGAALHIGLAHAGLEEDVKAAMAFKLLAYVQWPSTSFADATAPIRFAVIGADDIAAQLTEMVKGRQVEGRPVHVFVIDGSHTLEGVHAIYVGKNENTRLAQLAQRAQRYSVLTISDSPRGLEHGAIINLLTHDGLIRFEVSLAAAQQSHVEVSSRVLNLALRVVPAGGAK